MSLLALDVGNTSVTSGFFEGRRLSRRWHVETSVARTAAGFARAFRRAAPRRLNVRAAIVGSVVPSADGAVARALQSLYGLRPIMVGPRSPLGMRLKVDRPHEVGTDRVLNALAARDRVGGAAVVIDFGTATTFDCVSRRGDYLGGAILPGPNMASRALAEWTAQLPRVPVRRPRRAVGKNTVECIQAGLYFGYLGMIEKLLALTLKEMRAEGKVRVIATGGLSVLFKPDLPAGTVWEPDLTLRGLRIAYERLEGRHEA